MPIPCAACLYTSLVFDTQCPKDLEQSVASLLYRGLSSCLRKGFQNLLAAASGSGSVGRGVTASGICQMSRLERPVEEVSHDNDTECDNANEGCQEPRFQHAPQDDDLRQ